MGDRNEWTSARKGQLGIAKIDGEYRPVRVLETEKGKARRLLQLVSGEVCRDLGCPDGCDEKIVHWPEIILLPQGYFKDLAGLAERWAEMGDGLMVDQYRYVATQHFNPKAKKTLALVEKSQAAAACASC